MKNFLDSIKARFNKAEATLAQTNKSQQLEADAAAAKAEFDRFVNVYNTSTAKSEAHRVWTEAEHALSRYRASLRDAERDVQECSPLLTARDDLASAHGSYFEAQTNANLAAGEISNLRNLIGELIGEIAELGDKVQHALKTHGVVSVGARLIGQPAPSTPKTVLALNADLSSREATLSSAEAMLADAMRRHAEALKSAAAWRNQWEYARHLVAEIEYREILATLTPQIAIYLGSFVQSYESKIQFEPGDEALDAARQLLAAELEATPIHA